MSSEGKNLLRFRAFGPQSSAAPAGGEVSAAVFARKLSSLVRALKAADAAVNGSAAHDYTIARLHTSDPTALLREVAVPKFAGMFHPQSGVAAFSECVEAVKIGSPKAREFGACAGHIAALARPSKYGMAYSAVWTDSENEDSAIRLDSFLSDRAKNISEKKAQQLPEFSSDYPWFKGTAIGSFDGSLDVIDARGAFPQVKITLSAGGKTIDCICRAEDIQVIGASIKKRVRVTGRAIYDGQQGLPIRVEASEIAPIEDATDFSKWRGVFEPFEIADWEERE